jgi:hypothetical protein
MTISRTVTGMPRPEDIAIPPTIAIDITHIVAMTLEQPTANQPR